MRPTVAHFTGHMSLYSMVDPAVPNACGVTIVRTLMGCQISPVVALGGRSKRLMKHKKGGIYLVDADQVVFVINE